MGDPAPGAVAGLPACGPGAGELRRPCDSAAMSLSSAVIARRMHLPRAQTRDVVCERDLRVTMDDGAVLLADRWVARATRERPQPTVLVRSPYGRRQAVGLLFGRLLAERGLQVVIQSVRGTFGSEGDVQPVRRARRRPGHAALDPRAALARRANRDDRPQLPGPRAVGGRARGRRRPGSAGDPGQRLAVPRPDLRGRQPLAGDGGLVAGARRRAGAPARAAGDGPRAAPSARRCSRSCRSPSSTSAPPARRSRGFARRSPAPSREDAYWVARDFAAGVGRVTAPVQLIGGWHDIFLPWMLEDFAALQAAGRNAAARSSAPGPTPRPG